MNLVFGEFLDNAAAKEAVSRLGELVLEARRQPPLLRDTVIRACDRLSRSLRDEDCIPLLTGMGLSPEKAKEELGYARFVTSREYLTSRLIREFGGTEDGRFTPCGEDRPVRLEWKPLGVLMHIAAGNVDAAPVYSVLEGLLTGNVNILKLPGGDNGLSVLLLKKLIEIEPAIEKYVFVFDFPSADTETLGRIAAVSDAVTVWGGDEAVSTARKLATPDTKLIEWGHKLSFAYVSGDVGISALEGAAKNICETEQLLCNSCQGVFLDTDDFEEVCRFAERFAAILEKTAESIPSSLPPAVAAQKTLELYTEELEAEPGSKRVYRRGGVSVIAYNDSEVTASYAFRNCWVRPLPKDKLLSELSKYKNLLNTAALLCPKKDRAELEALFEKTGVVRITSGERMSRSYCGAPHDGELPLRRYMKLVSYEY